MYLLSDGVNGSLILSYQLSVSTIYNKAFHNLFGSFLVLIKYLTLSRKAQHEHEANYHWKTFLLWQIIK